MCVCISRMRAYVCKQYNFILYGDMLCVATYSLPMLIFMALLTMIMFISVVFFGIAM